jgi:hypothetical protein
MVLVRHAVIDTNLNNWRNQMLTYPKDHLPYTPAVKTDVLATFKRLGFVLPSELPEYQEKWAYYKSPRAL